MKYNPPYLKVAIPILKEGEDEEEKQVAKQERKKSKKKYLIVSVEWVGCVSHGQGRRVNRSYRHQTGCEDDDVRKKKNPSGKKSYVDVCMAYLSAVRRTEGEKEIRKKRGGGNVDSTRITHKMTYGASMLNCWILA